MGHVVLAVIAAYRLCAAWHMRAYCVHLLLFEIHAWKIRRVVLNTWVLPGAGLDWTVSRVFGYLMRREAGGSSICFVSRKMPLPHKAMPSETCLPVLGWLLLPR